jgi:hypothetical protein
MRQRRWLATGLATVVIGAVALVTGATLVALDDAALPWHAGIASTVGGSATASVTDDDGTTTTFTGTEDEAQAWLDREQERLKQEHGIDTRTATGGVLRVVGIVLLALGAGVLIWGMTTRRARTPFSDLGTDPSP